MAETVRVAMAQVLPTADTDAAVREAAAGGADVVVFPEMFSNGYRGFDESDPEAAAQWIAQAERPDGAYVDRHRQAARDHGINVVTTLLEAGTGGPFNTAILIAPSGEVVLRHRKVHTCFFENPEKVCGGGTDLAVAAIETAAGPVTVGMMICMDREYPEVTRTLSQRGAEIILVPNACDLVEDPVVGDVRLAQVRGRAFEDVVGIVVANYPRPRFDGHSFAVAAMGELLVVGGGEPGLVCAAFDLAATRQARRDEWFRWQDRPVRHKVSA